MANSLIIDCTKKTLKIVEIADEEKPEQSEDEILKLQRDREKPTLQEFAEAYYEKQKGNPELMDIYLAKVEAVHNKYPKKEESNEK